MGQKINPVSLRLQYTNRNFDNCWYSNYFYKDLINKDIFLQHYLNNFFKLLKLPTARYSIQHLQKKTQVFNFLCYSKSTREWRSKLFGLAKKKKILKKTRYFFKNKTEFKKRRKKYTKFNYFYNTLNQLAVHKIQKRITSFQNFRLWSALQKTTFHNSFYLPYHFQANRNNNKSNNKLVNLSDYLSLNSFCLGFRTNLNNSSLNNLMLNHTNICQQPLLIEKINQSNFKNKKKSVEKTIISNKAHDSKNLIKFLFLNKPSFFSKEPQSLANVKHQASFLEIKNNSSLLFLQNLFIYKTLKSYLKKKNKNNLSKKFHFLEVSKTNIWYNRKVGFNPVEYKYKNYLESSLSSFYNLELDLIPFRVQNDWQHANYLADEIVYFLEKRIPFRRLKNKILKQLSKISTIRGVRITCSGRVGGKSKKAQRSKTECIKYGQTSLQVFSSKIDFSVKTAFTSFGSVGVKVWVCYY